MHHGAFHIWKEMSEFGVLATAIEVAFPGLGKTWLDLCSVYAFYMQLM